MKLTKTTIDALPIPEDKHKIYRDDDVMGFGLRIMPSGRKSFIVEKRIGRKVRRKTLGIYGPLTPAQGRKEALKFLGKIAMGIDPIDEAAEQQSSLVTLQEVYETYLKVRKDLKANTLSDYRSHMNNAFKDWAKRPLANIRRDMISKKHKQIGEKHPARANGAMRFLRAIFNFAAGQYEDANDRSLFPENPVSRLSQTRAWYPSRRKQGVIRAHQLKDWYKAVKTLKAITYDPVAMTTADFLVLLLFTGMRKSEGLGLEWDDVDLLDRTLIINNTKNGQELQLPLSDFITDMLSVRKANNEQKKPEDRSLYVFPDRHNLAHLVDPRKQMQKVIDESGVEFTLHDLRRTFITIAESMDISIYTIKRLVNHKMGNDVTAGYIISDIERMRAPVQRISDFLKRAMALKGNVVNLPVPLRETNNDTSLREKSS